MVRARRFCRTTAHDPPTLGKNRAEAHRLELNGVNRDERGELLAGQRADQFPVFKRLGNCKRGTT